MQMTYDPPQQRAMIVLFLLLCFPNKEHDTIIMPYRGRYDYDGLKRAQTTSKSYPA